MENRVYKNSKKIIRKNLRLRPFDVEYGDGHGGYGMYMFMYMYMYMYMRRNSRKLICKGNIEKGTVLRISIIVLLSNLTWISQSISKNTTLE